MKNKISKIWNQSHGTRTDSWNISSDLDLGDMLKIVEEVQIKADLETIEKLEKMIDVKKKKIADTKQKYKKIRNKIAHDPELSMIEGAERSSFQNTVRMLGATKKQLGCSIDQFRILCEVQFEKGMTWDNWTNKNVDNAWNLDHIKERQSGGGNHWSNFAPCDRKENINKGKLESAFNHFLK